MSPTQQRQRTQSPPAPPPATNSSGGEFANFGQQLIAVREAALIQQSGTTKSIDARLLDLNRRSVAAGASEQVPADGGFLVQPSFAQQLVSKVYNTSEFLSRCRHYPITVDGGSGVRIPGFDEQSRADGSRFGGVRAFWQNEADTATATRPKFRAMELKLNKLLAFGYVTDELLQDAALLGAAMEVAFVNELKFKAEYAALFGSGAGQPLGVLSDGNPARIVVAKTSQSAGTILPDNIRRMWQRMWGPSRARSVWFCTPEIEEQLPLMPLLIGLGGSDTAMFRYTDDPDRQPYNLLCGRPVVVLEQMSSAGSVGDIALIDPGEYLIADKGGITSAVSLTVRFLTDELCYRFIWRIDGSPMWHTAVTPFSPFTAYEGVTTQSPYVTLAART